MAAPLKLDLAQYRSLAAFAQFASDLDKATRDQLTRGEKLSEVIKQPQYQPVPLERQVAILYIATKGLLDDIPTPRVKDFEAQFMRFLDEEITPRFPDGLTLMTGLGQFRGASGKIEQIRVLYERQFQQESVLRADERLPECVSF